MPDLTSYDHPPDSVDAPTNWNHLEALKWRLLLGDLATWRPGDLATWRPGDLAVARVASGCQGVSMGAGDLHQFAGDLLATNWRPTGDQLATYWRPTGDLLATFHWRPGEPGLSISLALAAPLQRCRRWCWDQACAGTPTGPRLVVDR